MRKPTLHLICNAHLDPVWQWQWEEGCAEALATFINAVQILHEHHTLIFNHNEAILYRWVQRYDPPLFREIQRLVKKGRWFISGGWYLQPDTNLPGIESLIRQIMEGRAFFSRYFDARPRVAYNFDSFGHTGGLPQVLKRAGYDMYIHMRPQHAELQLPSDLYRWRGVDGSEILTYRIAVGLYHTERDNLLQRLQEGTELALTMNRDVPVFWGLGNHGGGPTRESLEMIDSFVSKERRVAVKHSTPDMLYGVLRAYAKQAPVVTGDLQRSFTGCYTSLSRIKRRSQRGASELAQTESFCTASWWLQGKRYPASVLEEAWQEHLFNDFHDIVPGSCTQPAEQDALDLYGRVAHSTRQLRLASACVFNAGKPRRLYIPLTILNANPACADQPVEAECMLDLRPKWTGRWHLRLYTIDGKEIPSQEEQPESLLPFNGWRRKVCFIAHLPQLGAAHYELRIVEGETQSPVAEPYFVHSLDPSMGLITSLDAGNGRECLAGPLMLPLLVRDDADSWGSDHWSYRDVLAQFEPEQGKAVVLHSGPIRTVTRTVVGSGRSRVVIQTISYPHWPAIEYRLRILWYETHKMLKLSIPTVFRDGEILCEVPGGAMYRPADGQEHVQGRWCFLQGKVNEQPTALAVINNGQHGLDFKDGEIRLSVLRGAAYCHEQGFKLGGFIEPKYMDQGEHDVRLLVTAGDPGVVRARLTGLADWLTSPATAYSHLPMGIRNEGRDQDLLSIQPSSIRMTACKQSTDRRSMIIRLHETVGEKTRARLSLHHPRVSARLSFNPFELKTVRVERNGKWREVALIEES